MIRKATLRLIITFFCSAVVLILAEYLLRKSATHVVLETASGGTIESNPEFLVRYTANGRRLVPNAKVIIKNHFLSGEDVAISTNSLGFRDTELSKIKADNEKRILVLGDSITVADASPADETFVEITQKLLSNKYPDYKIEVINAGVGNIGIEEEREILEETINTVQPDLVLLAFYLNDSRPPWGFSGEIGNRGFIRRHSILAETLYRTLRQKQWEKEQGEVRFAWIEAAENLNWKSDNKDFLELAELAKYDWGAAWQEESWEVVNAELNNIITLSDSVNSKFGVVTFPVKFQAESEFLEDTPQKKIGGLTKSLNKPFLDLLPTLKTKDPESIYFDHCHLNNDGHEIVAEKLAEFIITTNIF